MQIDEESTDVEIKSVDSSREKSTFMGSLGLSVCGIVEFFFYYSDGCSLVTDFSIIITSEPVLHLRRGPREGFSVISHQT